MSSKSPVVVIIGNGVAGITVARTVRKQYSEARIRIISDESDYFFSRPALMYIYMGHMKAEHTEPYERDFYDKNRLERIRGRATAIDADNQRLLLKDGQIVPYDYLVIATGSVPNRFGWPGENLDGVQGLYSMQDLESLERWSRAKIKHGVIVGGGLIGIELAEMLHTRGIPCTFLIREDRYWGNILPREEAALVEEQIANHGIPLQRNTELLSIEGDAAGRAARVKTTAGELEADFVGLTAGVRPNVTIQHDSLETARGYLVDRKFRTSMERVFAVGDCAQFRNEDGSAGPVEQLWYTARMHGHALGRIIGHAIQSEFDFPLSEGLQQADSPADIDYDRGIWFNSAKFFQLEYQTYGFVPANPNPETTFYWQHPEKAIGFRMVWEGSIADGQVTGFNVFGLRYRQEVCEDWIRNRATPEQTIQNLRRANFDPEFFERPESRIKKAFLKAQKGAAV